MTQHPHDEIEAFALGSLDEEQQRAVLDHADTCHTCAVLLADAMAGVAALASLETPLPVERASPVAGVTSLRAKRPLAAWIASAAIAACLGLLLWNVQLRNEAVGVPIGALVHSHFTHHQLSGGSGSAKVLQAADGHWLYVVGDGLAPGARYALWETRGGNTVKAGDFVADRRGEASSFIEQPPGAIDALAIAAAGRMPNDASALHWP